jgi:hypothetical protein
MILNTPVVVANYPDAGGTAGTAFVARSAPDDITLLLGLTSMLVLPEADRLVARAPAYETRMLKSLRRVSNTPTIPSVTVLNVTTNIVARQTPLLRLRRVFQRDRPEVVLPLPESIRQKRAVGRDCL